MFGIFYSFEELKDRLTARKVGVPEQQELFEPGVETEPVEGAPPHVRRTVAQMNLPGGMLMDTRKFEKWVLESHIPLQDLLYKVEEQVNALADQLFAAQERLDNVEFEKVALKTTLNTTLSRLSRAEQLIRELKVQSKSE